MHILLYEWASYFQYDIKDILNSQKVSFDLLSWNFEDKNHDDRFLRYAERNISFEKYDCLFSINYWPLLSQICDKHHLIYISWSYDNPLNVRNIEDSLGNPCNRVYCFDRIQVNNYVNQGFDNVFHLPLGINSTRLSKISQSDPKCIQYKSDVSFLGKLYESPLDWILYQTDDYFKGFIHALINAQQDVYGAYLVDKVIDLDFIESINKSFRVKSPNNALTVNREELIYAISCEITRRDRLILLSLCGKRFQTAFYSYNDSSIISGVKKCPALDYWSEMPYMFAATKINLCPCFRAIQTGIPLRALDIMACGGLLLSNYQSEMDEYFINGQDLVLYESLPDAIEKIDYYLNNEDVRYSISQSGRYQTLKNFDMKDRLAYMLENL